MTHTEELDRTVELEPGHYLSFLGPSTTYDGRVVDSVWLPVSQELLDDAPVFELVRDEMAAQIYGIDSLPPERALAVLRHRRAAQMYRAPLRARLRWWLADHRPYLHFGPCPDYDDD